jgi:hypothetical protein
MKYSSSHYKKFIFQLLVFSGIGWLCLQLGVYFLCRPPEWFWIHNTIKIKENIAHDIHGKKIVFVGGSATLFGIRTEDIEKELNIPTVNYGIHAALEIDYILDRVKNTLNPGDVVILSLEYNHLLYTGSLNEVRTKYVLLFDQKYFKSLPFITKLKYLIQFSPLTIELSLRGFARKLLGLNEVSENYNANTLNKNGDETSNIGNDIINNKIDSIQPIAIQEGKFQETFGLKVLNNFNTWCNKHDIKFYVTYAPTISFKAYNDAEYQGFFNNVKNYFIKHNIKVIGNPNDFFYDKDFFYDTQYHLNSAGMTYHTKNLLSKIKDRLQLKSLAVPMADLNTGAH